MNYVNHTFISDTHIHKIDHQFGLDLVESNVMWSISTRDNDEMNGNQGWDTILCDGMVGEWLVGYFRLAT